MKQKLFTLEKGTCNYRASEKWMKKYSEEYEMAVGGKTFEDLKSKITEIPGSVALVPCIHEMNRILAYQPDYYTRDLKHTLTLENPPLYLARATATTIEKVACINTIRALVQFPICFLDVENTQAAARSVVEEDATHCITNQSGVDTYRLNIVERLKQMTILWIPYSYNSSSDVLT